MIISTKSSIRFKILLVGLLPVTSLAILLSVVFISQRIGDIDEALQNKVNYFAEYLAETTEFNLLVGNKRDLEKQLSSALHDDAIISVKIRDKESNLVAAVSKKSQSLQNDLLEAFDSRYIKTRVYPIRTDQVQINDYPPASERDSLNDNIAPNTVGWVQLSWTTFHASQQKNFILQQTITLILIALLLTAIFAIFLAKSVSSPLARLAEGVDLIKNGKLQHRINENSGGEIGVLEKNINTMAASLSRAQEIERQHAANLLQTERNKALTTLEAIGEGVITTDENAIVTYINPVALKLIGQQEHLILGRHFNEIFLISSEDGHNHLKYPIESCLEHGHTLRHDASLILNRPDGQTFVIRDTATPIYDHLGRIIGAVVVFDDFSTLKEMSEQLSYQATHDDLTGLYNRREFENQLDTALNETNRQIASHSILYIDLDQFKVVNDTSGHVAGDTLLIQLSGLFRSKIREHDLLARLGGDEFGIILRDCPNSKASEIANNLLVSVENFVFHWHERKFQIGISVGLVHLDQQLSTVSETLIAADSACYLAKERGRNCIHVYRATDEDQLKRHSEMKWLQRLKQSLEEDRFILYTQSITSTHDQNDTHYEILLRLDIDGQIFKPNTFLTAAERYNLMPNIDRWVVEHAFETINRIHSSHNGTQTLPCFNINLSGQSISKDEFLDYLLSQFELHEIDPTTITFEITETAAIANLDRAVSFMNSLRRMGCKFALDDFGSGLSSFGYLTNLPIDFIKIDGKIVRDCASNPIHRSIIKAINQIAHIMNLQTIAEFAEDQILVMQLRELGLDYVQGYAISLPTPIQEFFVSNN